MDIFVARQPIFDKDINVIAYELLYRDSAVNASPGGGDSATASVMINGPLMMGLETLTDHKKVFIKFTRSFLLDETVTLFGPDTVVVEVMEDIESDLLLVESLKRLKAAGYTIALDGYVERDVFGDVLTLADIIKVDFRLSDAAAVSRIAQNFRNTKVRLFAEKVETREQFETAARLGYVYFQGNFFEEPNVLMSKDIQSIRTSHVRIMQELYCPEPDFTKIASAIEDDLALTYKLLKLVNSGTYCGIGVITSIRQALIRLGLKELYKWMSLVVMRDAGECKPEVLARTSIIRARALESLAERVKLENRKTEFFLTGMFSLIDVILERPMEHILAELPLDNEIVLALQGQQNQLRQGLDIIKAYERADWDALGQIDEFGCGMTDAMLFEAYFDAIRWTQELYS